MNTSRLGKAAEKRAREKCAANGVQVPIADRLVTLGPADLDRFWRLVEVPLDPAACWPFRGYRGRENYGAISFGPRTGRNVFQAHRLSFILTGGFIPAGTELDHLCHTNDSSCCSGKACEHRACVNPSHLEVVDHVTNMHRLGQRITHCKRGHSMADAYVVPSTGRRRCRTCMALLKSQRGLAA